MLTTKDGQGKVVDVADEVVNVIQSYRNKNGKERFRATTVILDSLKRKYSESYAFSPEREEMISYLREFSLRDLPILFLNAVDEGNMQRARSCLDTGAGAGIFAQVCDIFHLWETGRHKALIVFQIVTLMGGFEQNFLHIVASLMHGMDEREKEALLLLTC